MEANVTLGKKKEPSFKDCHLLIVRASSAQSDNTTTRATPANSRGFLRQKAILSVYALFV